MANTNVNYQCPACGGHLSFSAEKGNLTCEYCDSVFTAEELAAFYEAKQQKAEDKAEAKQQKENAQSAAAKEDEQAPAADQSEERAKQANAAGATAAPTNVDPIQAYLDSKKPLSEDDPNATCVVCSSCGASMIVSDVTAVTHCPYCGNNAIVPGKLGNTLTPDLIIPFSVTKEQAIEALIKHYGGKICLPKEFKDKNHIEEIQGIYVPFWLYSGTTDGRSDFTATNIRAWSDSDYDYVETSTYSVWRSGACKFDKVPADGSQRMPDEHMDSIEPFDYTKLVPFSPGYLPGFAAERYDETVQECAGRVKSRMHSSLESELYNSVTGFDTVVTKGTNANDLISSVQYALLPVWMLHTRWNDQDFLFAMNGQTGKLVGDLPVDKKKLNLLSIGAGILTFAAIALITLLG